MMRKLTLIGLFISMCFNAFLLSFVYNTQSTKVLVMKHTDTVETVQEMDEWKIFTMALVSTECGLDSTAVSCVGATGPFQLTPIYIKQVNIDTDSTYSMADATNFEKSCEIFHLMQMHHNPEFDMDMALRLHNGDHYWYNKRVYDEMERIKKYEHFRKRLLDMDLSRFGQTRNSKNKK